MPGADISTMVWLWWPNNQAFLMHSTVQVCLCSDGNFCFPKGVQRDGHAAMLWLANRYAMKKSHLPSINFLLKAVPLVQDRVLSRTARLMCVSLLWGPWLIYLKVNCWAWVIFSESDNFRRPTTHVGKMQMNHKARHMIFLYYICMLCDHTILCFVKCPIHKYKKMSKRINNLVVYSVPITTHYSWKGNTGNNCVKSFQVILFPPPPFSPDIDLI